MTNCDLPLLGVYSFVDSRYHLLNRGDLANRQPHHSMKTRFINALQIVIPAVVFAAIIHDGLTLKTAHHSGTQHAIYTTNK